MNTFALLVLLVETTSAFMISDKCETPKSLSTLDLERFMGVWYEVFHFNAHFQNDQYCGRINFEMKNNGHINITLKGYRPRIMSFANTTVGDAFLPDPVMEPSMLKIGFNNVDILPMMYDDYWVLGTDYKTYNFMYSCMDAEPDVWIFSKQEFITRETKIIIFNAAKSVGLDPSMFVPANQTGCPYI